MECVGFSYIFLKRRSSNKVKTNHELDSHPRASVSRVRYLQVCIANTAHIWNMVVLFKKSGAFYVKKCRNWLIQASFSLILI